MKTPEVIWHFALNGDGCGACRALSGIHKDEPQKPHDHCTCRIWKDLDFCEVKEERLIDSAFKEAGRRFVRVLPPHSSTTVGSSSQESAGGGGAAGYGGLSVSIEKGDSESASDSQTLHNKYGSSIEVWADQSILTETWRRELSCTFSGDFTETYYRTRTVVTGYSYTKI